MSLFVRARKKMLEAEKADILVARANFEQATEILEDFMGYDFVEKAKALGKIVVDLDAALDTRLNFANAFKQHPEIKSVFIGGHGNYDVVTGQNYDILWKSSMIEELKVEGGRRDIMTISCRCGKTLGRDLIKYGAHCYKGYKEDFILMYGGTKPPYEDEYAKSFLLPAIKRCEFMYNDLLDADECEQKANEMSDAEIQRWRSINPQMANYIVYDKSVQVYYKEGQTDGDEKSWWEKLWEAFINWIKSWWGR
jgi:hypothetical protein